MEYELIDVGPCRKKLVLKFSSEDMDKAFDESYKDINNYVQLKGFRKGKAPRRALEKRFADEAASGAKQELIESNLKDVITKEKLQIIGSITDKNRNDLPQPGKSFNVDIEMDVAPDFELPEYKGLELSADSIDVSEDQVDKALERYRRAFANYTAVEEPAAPGDVVVVDFQAHVEGQDVMKMEDQRLRVEGDFLFGLSCPDLEEKFTGVKAGDTVTLDITMPEDQPNVDLRGKPAVIDVTVKGVERGDLPELDDTFAANLGMENMSGFRDRIRGTLAQEALMNARMKREEQIVDTLLNAVDYQAPLDMVESETNALIEQRRMQLLRNGAKDDESLQSQLEGYRSEAHRLALRQVRWGIMVQKIADKEEITVTNDDLARQLDALAKSYRTTPAKVLQHVKEMDGLAPMAAEILSMKVVTFISGNAKKEEGEEDTESMNAAAAETAVKGEAGEGEG